MRQVENIDCDLSRRGADSNGDTERMFREYAKCHEVLKKLSQVSRTWYGAWAMNTRPAGEPSLYISVRLIMRRTAKELAEAIGARLEATAAFELPESPRQSARGTRFDLRDAAKHAQRAAASRRPLIAAEGMEFLARRFCGARQPKVCVSRGPPSCCSTRADCFRIHPTASWRRFAHCRGCGIGRTP